jgi:hypothetical protein
VAEVERAEAVIGRPEVGFDRERRIAHILIIGNDFGDWRLAIGDWRLAILAIGPYLTDGYFIEK